MSPLVIALLCVLLVPLFVSTWRTSLLGLGLQGILMAVIAYRRGADHGDIGSWLTMIDLVVVRGLLVPIGLYTVMRRHFAVARNDVIPPNLLSWTIALGMVLIGFNFAEILIPKTGTEQTLVAVAAAGVMLGFLVLGTQRDPFSQMVGALRIENAIALFEISDRGHHPELVIQAGMLAVFVATVFLFRRFLDVLSAAPAAPAPSPQDATL